MPKDQHKSKINNTEKTMSPLEPNYPTTVGSENCNIAAAHGKDFKGAFINMVEGSA